MLEDQCRVSWILSSFNVGKRDGSFFMARQKIAKDVNGDGIDAKVNEATPDDGAEAVGTVVA